MRNSNKKILEEISILVETSSKKAAQLFRNSNYTEALSIYQELLQQMLVHQDDFTHEIATCHHNIASAYKRLNDFKKATEHYHRAVEIYTAIFGSEHKKTKKERKLLKAAKEHAPLYALFGASLPASREIFHDKKIDFHLIDVDSTQPVVISKMKAGTTTIQVAYKLAPHPEQWVIIDLYEGPRGLYRREIENYNNYYFCFEHPDELATELENQGYDVRNALVSSAPKVPLVPS